jgi:glycine oxidase
MRVAVIGGGVMGCASALALANAAGKDVEVIVLERAVPGAEASSAAAGILGAQIESSSEEDATLFARARSRYREWAEILRRETEIDVGYKQSGALDVAFDERAVEALRARVAWQNRIGLVAEMVDGRGAREIEPALADRVIAAAHFPDESQVDPRALLRALVAALARNAKIKIRSGVTVRGLILERDRCAGVRLEAAQDSAELRADATILAAGSWSSLLPDLPRTLPEVRPVRGQLIELDERPPRVRTIVLGVPFEHGSHASAGYVVPRGDGRVVCGSTMEHAGFRREVTAAGVASILSKALALVPSLGDAQVGASWSSFRPHADAPLVGASPLEGLFLATGHHRNGILLARETGERVAESVLQSRA